MRPGATGTHQRLHAIGQTGGDGRALAFVAVSVLVVGAGSVVFIVGEGLAQTAT